MHENGFVNGTFSPSSMVWGSGLFIVSGRNKLAIPPSVSKHPIIIRGSTSILLPWKKQNILDDGGKKSLFRWWRKNLTRGNKFFWIYYTSSTIVEEM